MNPQPPPAPSPAPAAASPPKAILDPADVKRRLDEAFASLKRNPAVVDVRPALDGLAEVERLLASDKLDDHLKADVLLRELEIGLAPHVARWTGRITLEAEVKSAVDGVVDAIYAVIAAEGHDEAAVLLQETSQAIAGYETGQSGLTPTQFIINLKSLEGKAAAAKARIEAAKSRASAGQSTVQGAIDAAMLAIEALRLAGAATQADSLLTDLESVVGDYETGKAGGSDRQFYFRLKRVELQAREAKARLDLRRTNMSAWVVGAIMVSLSLAIVLAIAILGKPGQPGFLKEVSPAALAAASAGVLLYIMATLRDVIDKFEFRHLPDFFFRLAQAWLYTILLSKLTIVNVSATPVDELAFAFLIGLFVYQIEKALGDIAVRLLPVEKFMERRGLTAPGTWQQSLQDEYNALFAQFTRAEILEKVEDVEEASILAEFNQVARLIAAADQEAAGTAMRSLTAKVNRVIAKAGAPA